MTILSVARFEYPAALIVASLIAITLILLNFRTADTFIRGHLPLWRFWPMTAVGATALLVGCVLFGVYSLPDRLGIPIWVRAAGLFGLILSIVVAMTHDASVHTDGDGTQDER